MSERFLSHIRAEVIGKPLLILPEKLGIIAEVLGGRIGIDAAALELGPMPEASRFVGRRRQQGLGGRELPYALTDEGVAIVTITGSLVNRGAWVGQSMSGLTSYEGIKHQLGEAAADTAVKSILLDLDTPGGAALGMPEVAAAVRAAAAVKPVVAVVNGMAASAGYGIASGATRIVTTPSGIAGSIGVLLLHADYSRMLEQKGITPTLIFAGAHKVDGNPYQPLTSDSHAALKAEVDRTYEQFVAVVTAGRKRLSAAGVKSIGAKVFAGADAVAAGLADDVGSFESVLAALSRSPTAFGSLSARPAASLSIPSTTHSSPAAVPVVAKAPVVDPAAIYAARRVAMTPAEAIGHGWDEIVEGMNARMVDPRAVYAARRSYISGKKELGGLTGQAAIDAIWAKIAGDLNERHWLNRDGSPGLNPAAIYAARREQVAKVAAGISGGTERGNGLPDPQGIYRARQAAAAP